MGKAYKFGDNIDTDVIIAARYLTTFDGSELAKHLMEDIDTGFSSKVKTGDVIVAGNNFGSGSSREHAPLAIKGAGVKTVIAKSFARIFYRNSYNIGFPIIESVEASEKINEGDEIEIDLEAGLIKNITQNEEYKINKVPTFMKDIIDAGGLLNTIK